MVSWSRIRLIAFILLTWIIVLLILCHYRTDNTVSLRKYPCLPSESEIILSGHREIQKMYDFVEIEFTNYTPICIHDDMSTEEAMEAFKLLTFQMQIKCIDWGMLGGWNGDWPVCNAMELLPQPPCVVYSFGINYDWSFDEAYHSAHGCTIRTFDPSMGDIKEHEHAPGILFYPMGLSNKKEVDNVNGWGLDSYRGFLQRFKEENKSISYLKFDIETSEWRVLADLLQDDVLKNVMQLSFEVHVDNPSKIHEYFKLLRGLEKLGFLRWYSMQRFHGIYDFQTDQSFINVNFLK